MYKNLAATGCAIAPAVRDTQPLRPRLANRGGLQAL